MHACTAVAVQTQWAGVCQVLSRGRVTDGGSRHGAGKGEGCVLAQAEAGSHVC